MSGWTFQVDLKWKDSTNQEKLSTLKFLQNSFLDEAIGRRNATSLILWRIIFAIRFCVKERQKKKNPASFPKEQKTQSLCQRASCVSRKGKFLGEDGCSADGVPDFCSPNWQSLLSHSSQLSFNIIPRLPVWFDALVRRQIRRWNTASDAPTATLLSLSSQICLCYACHSKAPWLIAFKIETESCSQSLNASHSHLRACLPGC